MSTLPESADLQTSLQAGNNLDFAGQCTSITGQFLRLLFAHLQSAGICYAVLRNYEGLPDKPGRDIDILTKDFKKLTNILIGLAQKNNYSVRIFRRYVSLVKFQLIKFLENDFEILEIDVCWSLTWKGIPIAADNLLTHLRCRREKFYTLGPGAEAAVSLMKDLISHGKVLEKYKSAIPLKVESNREGFLMALTPCFGASLSDQLADLTCQQNWEAMETLVPLLRRAAIQHSWQNSPVGQVIRWLGFGWWNLWKFIKPRGLFFVLIGPDGSGKTTVSEGVRHRLSPWFAGGKYFHGRFEMLPRLREIAKIIGINVGEEITSLSDKMPNSSEKPSKFSALRSLVYLCYYAFDYLLGYLVLARLRGRGELIIFDRYCYDNLIQQRMSLPPWLIWAVIRLAPKPDAVIYLSNSPEVILSRKNELTLRELERQAAVCRHLIDRLPQGAVVETTGTIEMTINQVAKILVSKMACQI